MGGIIKKRLGEGLDQDKTDWDKISNLTDVDIDSQIQGNADAAPAIDWNEIDLVKPTPKTAISIRLDEDVIAYFRLSGKGYQSRINEVLRSFMEHQAKTNG